MRNLGKITGVFFALMISAGFWGIILGLVIGHMFDKVNERKVTWFTDHQEDRQSLFFSTIFEVIGHITKSKGRVTKMDIYMTNQLMDQMNLYGESRIAAQNSFRMGKEYSYPLREKIYRFRKIFYDRSDLIQTFLEIQIQAAFSDNFLHPKERKILYIIAEELGISNSQLKKLLLVIQKGTKFSDNFQYKSNSWHKQKEIEPSLEEACNILGVKINDEIIVIKRAYRKLMGKHHPDKLLAKGLSTNKLEIAKKKAQNIQKAYQLIKKQKGFK